MGFRIWDLAEYEEFLSKKPLFYKKIDYERMPRVWKKIKHHFRLPKIIHIVGTNGKGTTGRYLAYLLYRLGESVGHYTSPHILKFNERFWKSGSDIEDSKLQDVHSFLSSILEKEDLDLLSYFEYATLMALALFQDCKYAIFEAGMGGEYDATSVFDSDLSIVTPIDYDHQEFLGSSIKDIASTKLKSIKKCAIIGKQPHKEVYEIAKNVSKQNGFKLYRYEDFLDDFTKESINNFATKKMLPNFLIDNLSLAVSAFSYLGYRFKEQMLLGLNLSGRYQKIAKNITIDVGHNLLAAKAIRDSFMGRKVILVYNSYQDKDYVEILKVLKPIVKRVEILKVENKRVEKFDILKRSIEKLNMKVSLFEHIDNTQEYLVFGSFSVVEKFLKDFFER